MWSDLRTRYLVVAGAAVLVALVAALLWPRGVENPSDGQAAGKETRRDAVVVVAASGRVFRSVGSRWTRARTGDELRAAESIRTGADGTAEITLGSGGAVKVAERSEITIREFTAAVQRLGITRGRMSLDLRADDLRILRAEDRSGTIFASASGGRWHVVATPRGLGVAAGNGEVRVESAGASVDVPPANESAAWRGATPLPPTPVPRNLTVRLAPGKENRRARVCAVLETDVASEVLVDGDPAEVRADGGVTVTLKSRAKRRVAEVVVRHATGKVERKTIRCGEDGVDLVDVEERPKAL